MTRKAASDIGNVGGVVNPASPHPSSQPSPASPPQMAPLDYLQKHNIRKMFSDHIKRDTSCLERLILPYFRHRPPLPTSSRAQMITDILRPQTTSSSATSTLSCSKGFRPSTSTSTYINRKRTWSTSRSHRRYLLEQPTRMLKTSRRSCYNSSSTLRASWRRLMNLKPVEFYVHIPGSHHNIKSSS